MLEQCQGPIWILIEYKRNPKFAREEIDNPKVSRLPRAYDWTSSHCAAGDSAWERAVNHHEAMCLPQRNFSKDNWPRQSEKTAERCGTVSCWIWADISTIILQHYDTSSSAPCEKEIDILEPVFLHNMFPFERFMGVLKKCVRNHAHPEGSIASAYGTEEVIDFCVDFIDDLKPIGVPKSRFEGRLKWKGHTTEKISCLHR